VGQASTTRSPVRHSDGRTADDEIAVEEPLEIRVATETVAVTMRTPGDDRHLALGFLFAEGVIGGVDDVGSAVHCGRPGEEGYGNVIDVTPAPGAHVVLKRLDSARRGTLTTSACGICGRKTIDDLLAARGPLAPGPVLAARLISQCVAGLAGVQPGFSRTGGLHAAAVFDLSGALLASAEDVGRHNAVDKAIGALLAARAIPAARTPTAPALLVVSGRASFEITQKAAAAGLALLASVSAPSSLAVDLAERLGLTLVSFARGSTFNVMAHPHRVTVG
jgi:FdhD protein